MHSHRAAEELCVGADMLLHWRLMATPLDLYASRCFMRIAIDEFRELIFSEIEEYWAAMNRDALLAFYYYRASLSRKM